VYSPKHADGRRSAKAPPCATCPVKTHNICRPLDPERQKALYESQQTWRRGQFLYRAGDPLGPIFKLISGVIAVSKRLPDGRRQVLDFFFPGEICGYLETGEHYTFEGQAITSVTACVFNRARFKAFTGAHDDLTEIVRATLAWKLESVSHHTAVLGQLTAVERLATFLGWLAVRSGEQGIGSRTLPLPMTRDDIADYLGVRMETVSRAFSELRRRRIIELGETRVRILDPERLVALSSHADMAAGSAAPRRRD
jgi:CRP/FNR family transcriptional regulator